MSANTFPTSTQLIGTDISISREPIWDTIVQANVSGKEVRIARRIYPRRTFGLKFNFLRSSTTGGFSPATELQTLEGFFNSRQGMFDSFLWTDPDDNTITGQTIGTGDSTTVAFQLIRSFGGFVEPIYAPNVVTTLTVGSTATTSTWYSLPSWGSTSPGLVTFSSLNIPPTGQAIVASLSYFWPVRFTQDNMTFERFVNLIYENKKVEFETII